MKTKKQGAPKKYAERVTIQHSIELETLKKIDKIAEMNTTRTDLINEYIRKGLAIFATVLVLASCSKTEPGIDYVTYPMDTFSAAVYECETIEHVQLLTQSEDWLHVNTVYTDVFNSGDNPPKDSVWYKKPNELTVYRYSRTCKIK